VLSSGLSVEAPLEDHVDSLMRRVDEVGVNPILRGMVDATELDAGFAANNGQGGFALSHPTLERIAANRLGLSVSLWHPTQDMAAGMRQQALGRSKGPRAENS
jgi:hypothetical protein